MSRDQGLSPERIAEFWRLHAEAIKLESVVGSMEDSPEPFDEETYTHAAEAADYAQEALNDAIRGAIPALLSAASRLAEVEATARHAVATYTEGHYSAQDFHGAMDALRTVCPLPEPDR